MTCTDGVSRNSAHCTSVPFSSLVAVTVNVDCRGFWEVSVATNKPIITPVNIRFLVVGTEILLGKVVDCLCARSGLINSHSSCDAAPWSQLKITTSPGQADSMLELRIAIVVCAAWETSALYRTKVSVYNQSWELNNHVTF